MNQSSWSKKEKGIARHLFKRAYERESNELIKKVKDLTKTIKTSEDLWDLHDFLKEKRKEIDKKYDYSSTNFLFLFGRLLDEEWIRLDDFEGLSDDKIDKIKDFAKLLNERQS